MQDVQQMDGERCRQLRGVAFDIDDTVTSRGRLEPDAYQAFWRLRAAGLRLVAVTGRPLGWADLIARQWPVDVAVGENGAGWAFVREGRVHEGYHSSEADRRTQEIKLQGIVAELAKQWPHLRLADDQRARRCDAAFDIGETCKLDEAERNELAEAIMALGARCLISSVHAHVILGDWNKASGIISAVGEACGIDVRAERDRWLFVGDSGNDADAFSYFPFTAGVANVADHLASLPVSPRFVARSPRGRGFAEIADTVLAHRTGSPLS